MVTILPLYFLETHEVEILGIFQLFLNSYARIPGAWNNHLLQTYQSQSVYRTLMFPFFFFNFQIKARWWFQHYLLFSPDLSGKWSTGLQFHIFQMGWFNHQLEKKSLDEVEAEDGNVKLWCRGSSDQTKWLICFFRNRTGTRCVSKVDILPILISKLLTHPIPDNLKQKKNSRQNPQKKHVEICFAIFCWLKSESRLVGWLVGWFWCFGTEVVPNWSLIQLPAPSTISKFHEGGSRGPVVGKGGKVERWYIYILIYYIYIYILYI